jgi:hypothetical protein
MAPVLDYQPKVKYKKVGRYNAYKGSVCTFAVIFALIDVALHIILAEQHQIDSIAYLLYGLTDVTGNQTSVLGVFEVTDAFGLVPPVIQGADLLTELLDALVVLPDYFDGKPALLGQIDKDGEPIEEIKDQYMKFVKEKAQSPENLPKVIFSAGEAKLNSRS